MIDHGMNPVDFLLTELLHDGFFSLRKLGDPLLSTVVDTLNTRLPHNRLRTFFILSAKINLGYRISSICNDAKKN